MKTTIDMIPQVRTAPHRAWLLLGAICLAGMLSPAAPAAPTDTYRNTIESEVDELPQADPAQEPAVEASAGDPAEEAQVEEATPQEEFEDLVRNVYPGSYFLYRKLAEDQQQLVLKEYLQTGDLKRVRRAILEQARKR